MSVSYDWIINNLITIPDLNGLHNVVKKIHYAYTAYEEIEGDFVQATLYGIYDCESPSKEEFVAHENISESTIIQWLESSIDMQSLKSEVDSLLDKRKQEASSKIRIPF
jgi:hypothetical protein